MTAGAPALNCPISDAELRRRGDAVRAAMEREGIDVLVLYANNDDLGTGYVKYLTDIPTAGYGTVAVVPREEEITLVFHGPLDGDHRLEHDGVMRGVGRVLTSPYFPAAPYTRDALAELTGKALVGYEHAVVGLVGTSQMPVAIGERVKTQLRDTKILEASELLDAIKAIKSDEEQDLVRRCAAAQDAALAAAFAAAEPGKRESEITAVARHVASDLGAEAGIVLIGSGPPGAGWTFRPRHLQERVLEDGDMIALLVELNGPGGMFTELGRTAVLGTVPPEVEAELELVLEAQRFTLERLLPGRPIAPIWEEYNEFLRERGRPPEERIHCHGQGLDIVERPLVRFDEPWNVEVGINVACHPTWLHNGLFSWICDNYLVGPDGPGECLHATPQRIIEL